jgi:membrane protein
MTTTHDDDREVGERLAGEEAGEPTQIPPRGWWQVVRRAFKESGADNVPMLAGGVAFFAFLAIFPAIIAAFTLYGLVADPQTVAAQVRDLSAALPQQAQPIIADQLQSVTSTSGRALGIGLVISLLAALWSASSGTGNLIKAVNLAYDEDETRGFLKVRGIALLLTLGAIVFVLGTLALVAVVPVLLDALPLGPIGTVLAQVVRWVLLVALVVVALAAVYRLAPDRDSPRFAWVTTGSLAATALWIIGSILFSLYVNNFGSYNKTYGTIAGVVVLMLWLYLTSYIVLLGAEINAESERQTTQDTTRGAPAPRGERGAAAADEIADDRSDEGGDQGDEDRPGSPAMAPGGSGSPHGMNTHRVGDLEQTTTGELVTRLSTQVSALVRGELELAKTELAEKGKRLGVGAGLAGGAGVLAGYGTAILLVAAVAGLALVWPMWLAALVVCAVVLIVAGLLGLSGRSRLRRATPVTPHAAAQSIRDDVAVVRKAIKR